MIRPTPMHPTRASLTRRHPLRAVRAPASIAAIAAVFFGALLAALLATACLSEAEPTPIPPTPTPTPSPTPTPIPVTADDVVSSSRRAMIDIGSAWFNLEHENGAVALLGVDIDTLEGAANDQGAELTAKASIGRLFIELDIILIGDQVWITNPLTGRWEEATDSGVDIDWNLARGVTQIFDAIRNPSFRELPTPGREFVIESSVPAQAFDTILAGSVNSDDDVFVTAFVDPQTYLVREMTVDGILTTGDVPETRRILEFSRYGEPFVIVAPR